MSTGLPHNDQVTLPTESGDQGMGQTPLFDIKEMGLLPNALKGMFATAELSQDIATKILGPASEMLPYTAGSARQRPENSNLAQQPAIACCCLISIWPALPLSIAVAH